MRKVVFGFVLGACSTAVAGSWAPTVQTLESAPVRVAPSGKARVQELAVGSGAWVGRLSMDGGAAVPEHRDPTEETIHVLSGSGVVTIDGQDHELGPGSTVFMPAEARVSFQNGPETLVALQVFAGPQSATKYEAWSPEI